MNSAEPNYDTSSETKMENYDLGDHSQARLLYLYVDKLVSRTYARFQIHGTLYSVTPPESSNRIICP